MINGDASGIDDDDQREADAFVESVGAGSPVDCADAGFIRRPDFGARAGDCQRYTFLRPAPSTYNRARVNCSCRHHAFPCEKCETLKDTANASRHTPEPWEAKNGTDIVTTWNTVHGGPNLIARAAWQDSTEYRDSNARRIVACVNACAGMTDPAKEIASLRGMLADAALQLARLTGPALETYARTFAALAGKGGK